MSGIFMHRFFSPTSLTETVTLQEGPLFHQILNVFRAKKGDRFIFFEVYGDDRVYEVIDISKKRINLEQKEIIPRSDNQSQRKQITVFQAFPNKVAIMETIVQKMVEIGVHQLVFFSSDRSQIHEIPAAKIARLTAIAQEALEQS
jgi:RsmE family RNA methyltransferase